MTITTSAEFTAAAAMHAGEFEQAQGMTIEQLRARKAELIFIRDQAQRFADDATTYRPSYSPAGKLTRSEASGRAALKSAQQALDLVSAIIGLRQKGLAIPQPRPMRPA